MPEREPDVRGELLTELVAQRSMVTRQELEARALEIGAGAGPAAQAASTWRGCSREGELVELEGGWWTTRELRELEQRTLDTVASAPARRPRVASPLARAEAA
jgi:hypothetical protein